MMFPILIFHFFIYVTVTMAAVFYLWMPGDVCAHWEGRKQNRTLKLGFRLGSKLQWFGT